MLTPDLAALNALSTHVPERLDLSQHFKLTIQGRQAQHADERMYKTGSIVSVGSTAVITTSPCRLSETFGGPGSVNQ